MNEAIFVDGPAGRLEGVLRRCPGARAGAVVCHSHPLYGGSLHDKVVSRVARALFAAGMTVLRFNFRGVGASEGAFHGEDERDDVRAALERLAPGHDGLLVAGYSFGAWVGLAAGLRDARVTRMVGIGLPVRALDFGFLGACPKPLLVHGSEDAWGELAAVRALGAEVVAVAGADHHFRGATDAVMRAVGAFATR